MRFPKAGFESYSGILSRQLVELFRNLRRSVRPRMLLFASVAVIALRLFGGNLKDILFVAVLAFIASYSTIYKRTIRVPSAVELVTLGTVVTGAAYGPVVGALFGILATFASEIISSGIDVFTLFYAVARGITGSVSSFFVVQHNFTVLAMGMVALVIWHVVCDWIYILSGDVEAKLKVVYFAIVNTLFNLLVFTFFGKLLFSFANLNL